jgi:hypothetical protein
VSAVLFCCRCILTDLLFFSLEKSVPFFLNQLPIVSQERMSTRNSPRSYQRDDDYDLQSLLEENDRGLYSADIEAPKTKTRAVYFIAALCLVAAAIGYVSVKGTTYAVRYQSAAATAVQITPDNLQETCGSMSVIASNEYGVYNGAYPFLANGELLIEPYKNTTLEVSISSSYTTDQLGLSFQWVVNDEAFEGSKVTTAITNTGTSDVVVNVINAATNEQICSYNVVAYVKYVKRELRTLSFVDRERMLDAVAALWKFNQTEGQDLFGEGFTSIQTFVEEHASASNDIMCDQFHDGSGFVTHHIALGLAFEASVRSVDPSVTIPYWDFSIDGEALYRAGEEPSQLFKQAPFFTSEWFGAIDEDRHIADGRWAHAKMPLATKDEEEMTRNSFGIVRSYWNNNADLEITRSYSSVCGMEPKGKTIPTCQDHLTVLNSADLGTFQDISPSQGHGPLHVQLGGIWGGCSDDFAALSAKWADLLDADVSTEELASSGHDMNEFFNRWGYKAPRREIVETVIIGELYTIYRSLWRSHVCTTDHMPGYLECPESCDIETQADDCSCKVNALVNGSTTTNNLIGCVVTKDNVDYFDAVFPDEFMEDVVNFVATTHVIEGDMIESASSADPLFWFIHPVLERLLQAKRNSGVSTIGSTTFSKWGDVDGNEQEFMEWSLYSFDKDTMPFHTDAYTCAGHAADSPVLPSALSLTPIFSTNGADLDGDGVISNYEFYLALDPGNPDMNDYVFDNFEWTHCS